MVRRAQRVADVTRLAELLQVLAGAEPAARSGDDDGAHLGVARFLQRVAQRRMKRPVERVEHLRTVECDRLHRAVARDLDLRHWLDPIAP